MCTGKPERRDPQVVRLERAGTGIGVLIDFLHQAQQDGDQGRVAELAGAVASTPDEEFPAELYADVLEELRKAGEEPV